MNTPETPNGTQAVQRALALLRALGERGTPLTPQELARHAGINRSTAYRLLGALELAGLVASDQAGRYRLGPELIALGSLALRQIDLRQIALPTLRALASQSGETIDLEIMQGGRVLIIEEIAGDHMLSVTSSLGATYPAHCTATGKALLAHLPPASLDAYLAAPLAACGPATLRNAQALRAELGIILSRGYATSYEELEQHLHAIGTPIFDHDRTAVAAVSISGPAARLPREREAELAASLLAACATISQQLGYRP